MRDETIAAGAIAVLGTLATAIFGAWDQPLKLLLLAMALDYVTGFVSAAYRGDLSSDAGLKGIAKKLALLLMVGVANLVDQLLAVGAGEYLAIELPTGTATVRTLACFVLAMNELVSILENLAELGAPIPEPLERMVRSVRNRGGDGNDAGTPTTNGRQSA